MTIDTLKSDIILSLNAAQKGASKLPIYKNSDIKAEDFKNEFVFFIKPEITQASATIQLSPILDTVFEKLEKFNVDIIEVTILGASHLKENNVMASHYGVINKIATNPRNNLSEDAKVKFFETYGERIEDTQFYGGVEFQDKTGLSAKDVDDIWAQGDVTKLAGGTYVSKVTIDENPVYLFNGFHPLQLEHFIAEGRSIAVFHAVSNTDWNVLRTELIGATDPAKAKPGSLRHEFLQAKQKFGLEEVSQGSNGVHLSAGPIEGMAEISRFFNGPNKILGSLDGLKLGIELKSIFGTSGALHILNDGKIAISDKVVGSYDATEEKNSDEAVALLKTSALILP